MNKRERDLENKGYKFSGDYSRSKDEMKQAVEEYRRQGFLATVVSKLYAGRIGSTTGYSVYVKKGELI